MFANIWITWKKLKTLVGLESSKASFNMGSCFQWIELDSIHFISQSSKNFNELNLSCSMTLEWFRQCLGPSKAVRSYPQTAQHRVTQPFPAISLEGWSQRRPLELTVALAVLEATSQVDPHPTAVLLALFEESKIKARSFHGIELHFPNGKWPSSFWLLNFRGQIYTSYHPAQAACLKTLLLSRVIVRNWWLFQISQTTQHYILRCSGNMAM